MTASIQIFTEMFMIKSFRTLNVLDKISVLLVSVLNWSHGNHFYIIFMHISTFTARSLSLRGKLLLWGHEDRFDVILMHF